MTLENGGGLLKKFKIIPYSGSRRTYFTSLHFEIWTKVKYEIVSKLYGKNVMYKNQLFQKSRGRWEVKW